jgi:hypothetical protein
VGLKCGSVLVLSETSDYSVEDISGIQMTYKFCN